jgi:hypothetical protein
VSSSLFRNHRLCTADPFAALLVEPFKVNEEVPFSFDYPPQVVRRTSGSSTPFTPFEAAEDYMAQFLQLDDDASTPPLIYDEAIVQPSLFGLVDPPSPAFAFRSYAPALGHVDASQALKSPSDDALPYTCSPVELTADSPPFAVERPLPQTASARARTRTQEPESQHEQEDEEQAKPASPAPKTRKRKAKFTGSRNTEIPMVDLTAPVADR